MHINQRQLFFSNLAQTSDFPLAIEIEKAEGVYLYGADGTQYLDLISGIGVSNVGHRHPEVLKAVHAQLDKYLHLMVYGEYIQSPQVQLARALTETLDFTPTFNSPYGKIDNVYFTNSGTEAVEGAMKLAKRFTGRHELIACFDAYHGATQGALSLAGSEWFKQNFRPLLPGITSITHGDHNDLQKITIKTAAIIIEVVGGESGVKVANTSYLQALRQRCTETGTLLIFDEVQTGFGRTGTFWAFEPYDVHPDILLSAKGMGGGMPIGAFMASNEIMSVLKNKPILGHITTFGGHPVSCAAALATLKIVKNDLLLPQVEGKGQLIRDLLKHPLIKELRGKGLMRAAEFESFDLLKRVIDGGIKNGIITDWFLFNDRSMRIAPPLTISKEQIEAACNKLLEVMDDVQ
jgi:acetylornithine/succinyldiaminopimelate/putrescine aminotransferase